MLNISGISEGFVLDHIQAGMSLKIYHDLGLDKLDCTVAIIKNARSSKMGTKDIIKVEELKAYPYLVFEQGEKNSFYYAEEFLSMLDFPKNIQVRDRATLFNLVIGLNGFTVSSGVIDRKLNSESIIAKPLDVNCYMRIGTIRKKNIMFSKYAFSYMEALKKHLSIVLKYE